MQLNHQEIVNYANIIVERMANIDECTNCALHVLNITGVRSIDLLKNPNFFPLQNTGEISFTQQKTNVPQIINPFDYAPLTPAQILGKIKGARKLCKLSHQKNMLIAQKSVRLSTGGKDIKLHFFRHAFACRLFLAGHTMDHIAAKLGLVSSREANTYVHGEIFMY